MVELRVLGALRVHAPEQPEAAALVRQARRAALLAYLAVATPRGAHRRDTLLALFWPELDAARARAALNQAVYVLRGTLGMEAIETHGDGAIGVTDAVWCDAVAFEAALDAGQVAEAMALYRGYLLDGFFISGAPGFEHWLDGERERLRRRASEAAWALAESRAAEGDHVEAEGWARRATDLYPSDEAGLRRIMGFLQRLGDRAAAIRAYEAFVARARQEYAIEPSPETLALVAAIRQEQRAAPQPPLTVSAGPPPAAPVPARRRVGVVGWTASALIVAGIALGAWAGLRNPGPPAPPVVRFTLEFPPGQEMALGVPGPTLALSPDGSQLAYLARGPRGTELFLRSLDQVAAVPIAHTVNATMPFFAPDSAWLGFVVGGAIHKVPLQGGAALTVSTAGDRVSGASWGPNDGIVFATPAGLWHVSANGGEARALATPDTGRGERYLWPEVLPSGRAVLVTIADSLGFRLAAVPLPTGAIVPLGVGGTSPRFANGYLLYARTDGALLAAPFDAVALRVTGPAQPLIEQVEVGVEGAAKFGVSRTGTLAYATRSGADRTLAMVDRAGGAVTLPAPPRGYAVARLSPDGRQVVAAIAPPDGQPDIWALDPTGSIARRLTFDGASVSPTWSPDGGSIVFSRKHAGRPGWDLRRVRAGGTDSPETLLPGPLGGGSPEFTPDGRMLVFHRRDPRTGFDLWTLELDGHGSPHPYVRGPAHDHSAAVSPDGRWVAHVSNASGQDEVYVRPLSEAGAAVQVSTDGGREPRWAPDGSELFYRTARGLVAASVRTSPSFEVDRRAVLFDAGAYLSHPYGAAYDVHPDGRRFLMVRLGPESERLVVVVNGLGQATDVARGSGSR